MDWLETWVGELVEIDELFRSVPRMPPLAPVLVIRVMASDSKSLKKKKSLESKKIKKSKKLVFKDVKKNKKNKKLVHLPQFGVLPGFKSNADCLDRRLHSKGKIQSQ